MNMLDDTRSPLRTIVSLAWPAALAALFHESYAFVDMFWVSWLGKEAIAAVALTGIVLWAVMALSQVFATGVQALVARAHGADQRTRADQALHDGLIASLVTGILATIPLSIYPVEILSLLGAKAPVAALGAPYLRLMALAVPALIASITLGSAFRGAGDMITPLAFVGASAMTNMVLDPILIFGAGPIPPLGLAGAALVVR